MTTRNVQGAWPPAADAGSLSASQKAAKQQPNDTPNSIRHMLSLVSGSQGALPTGLASLEAWHPPVAPRLTCPTPAFGKRPSSQKPRQSAGKGTMGHRLKQCWEPDTEALNPSFTAARSPLPRGQYLTGTLPNCID